MAQQSDQPPDLATVLANLRALAPAAPQQSPSTAAASSSSQLPTVFSQAPLNAEYNAVNAGHNGTHTPLAGSGQPGRDPRLAAHRHQHPNTSPTPPTSATPTPTPQASSTPVIDPATITEWSHGLRCVSKIAAQNKSFQAVIKRMIADQREHELMWWGGRQALMNQKPSEEELKAYDKKVYRAQKEMQAAMSGQLKSMGVPFFGMKPEMVASPAGKEAGAAQSASSVQSGSKAKISEDELLRLQRKMLEYLEDMYKE